MKKAIAQILLDEGYIKDFKVIEDGGQGVIRITLKYTANNEKVNHRPRSAFPSRVCVSTPGAEELPQVLQRPGHCHHFHIQGRYDR